MGAGLPQIAELAGDAKSYAERLFKFPAIANLSRVDAEAALQRPAQEENIAFSNDALETAFFITDGYPYFIQELGHAVWTVADGPGIRSDDVRAALPVYEAKLDKSSFRVRMDRSTDLQRAYLRAMAQLGPAAQKASDVADVMGRLSTNVAPTRAGTDQYGFAVHTGARLCRFHRRVPGRDLLVRSLPVTQPLRLVNRHLRSHRSPAKTYRAND